MVVACFEPEWNSLDVDWMRSLPLLRTVHPRRMHILLHPRKRRTDQNPLQDRNLVDLAAWVFESAAAAGGTPSSSA
jgi:hypothetical protein